MCQLIIGATSALWESHSRSLRIKGVSTSVRLEIFFWNTLEEIAYRDDMTVTELITKLYIESTEAKHNLGNFSSFLRVCCGRYHALISVDAIPSELSTKIRSLQAEKILKQEQQLQEQKQVKMVKGNTGE